MAFIKFLIEIINYGWWMLSARPDEGRKREIVIAPTICDKFDTFDAFVLQLGER